MSSLATFSRTRCWCLLLALVEAQAVSAVSLESLSAEHRVWRMSEFALTGVPEGGNPYDPDAIAVDVTFTGPSGKTAVLPAFRYQGYTRAFEADTEKLSVLGEPEWRVRFTPLEAGTHRYRLEVRQNGVAVENAEGALDVADKPPDAHGFVRVEPAAKRFFVLDDATPLPLIGECLCWHGKSGTYDYDAWLGKFAASGMNWGRLWMWDAAFGIEFLANERLNYNQERAWRLDYVLDAAAQRGIYLMLCLDYHGIFQVEKDMWGGNDWWPRHPYNAAQGGPCATQRDFFTSAEAKALYRKRLRYLIGRYGAQPALMAWEFFNEINIPMRYLRLPEVVAWHGEMGDWLHAQDPYRHLVSTSLASHAEVSSLWKLEAIDFTQYHLYYDGGSYKEDLVSSISGLAARFQETYRKPFVIGEFGISFRGPDIEEDPYRRGLRQGLWAALLSGSAGTAMPWWWESFHAADAYPTWDSLAKFIEGTGFGAAPWRPAQLTAAADRQAAVKALAMTDGRQALLWMVDDRYIFPRAAKDDAQPRSDASIVLHGLPDGPYTVTWWDPAAGAARDTATATSQDNAIRIEAPAFNVDIAAKVVPAAK